MTGALHDRIQLFQAMKRPTQSRRLATVYAGGPCRRHTHTPSVTVFGPQRRFHDRQQLLLCASAQSHVCCSTNCCQRSDKKKNKRGTNVLSLATEKTGLMSKGVLHGTTVLSF